MTAIDIQLLNTVKISTEEALKYICVRPPYFALQNIVKTEAGIAATFNIDSHCTRELFPLGPAETGRHIAILGSIALSMENSCKKKHYYLAEHARVERINTEPIMCTYIVANITHAAVNKNKGTINGELYSPNGVLLYKSYVEYSILAEAIFERFFGSSKTNFLSSEYTGNSPYKEQIKLSNMFLDKKSCRSTLGMVQNEHCVGHFDNYPAIPVARMASALCQLAGQHFLFLRNEIDSLTQYVIKHSEIFAYKLTFAGKNIDLYSELIGHQSDGTTLIQVFATVDDGVQVARLDCFLTTNNL